MMDPIRLIGGCASAFAVAVAFDVVGLVLLFVGIFADVRLDGRFFGDFFIHSGALLVFGSLFCWLVWYAGNLPVSEDGGPEPERRGGVARLVRKLSERLGRTLRGEERAGRVELDHDEDPAGSRPHEAGRVTWGKSTVYHNEGYLDPPSEGETRGEEGEREEREEREEKQEV